MPRRATWLRGDRVWDAWDELIERNLGWDEVEPVVNPLVDALVEAGFARTWGHSDTGCFLEISDAGHERLRALGRSD